MLNFLEKTFKRNKTIKLEIKKEELEVKKVIPEFKPLSIEALTEILGLTIKKDNMNKAVAFLCQLSAYTENSQFNVSFNAPSSTGKSYIPIEIAKLFPKEDVLELAHCTPTAFFHEMGKEDKSKKGEILVDLSRKIIIFLDQPNNELLARMRPILSHDKKEIISKITDRKEKQGLRTKTVIMRGYPSVIFCTAGFKVDEQEATRFLLLSPEMDQEKIREGVSTSIEREADRESYEKRLGENQDRRLLIERLRAIKEENIEEIKITHPEKIEKIFLGSDKKLKPRHQRDVKRLSSIIKSIALLNLWWRDKDGKTITANEEDIDQALKIWDSISKSQELNLPPFVYDLHIDIILPLWEEKVEKMEDEFEENKTIGLTRQEIKQKYYEITGRMLDGDKLRQHILPMLEIAGLITQESNPDDKRSRLIIPIMLDEPIQEPEGIEENKNDNTEEILNLRTAEELGF